MTLYMKTLMIATLMSFSLVHAAEYNGEHWESTFQWYIDASCPALVKTAVEEALDRYSPVDTQFVGIWSKGISQDSASVIYCGDSDVQQAQLQAPLPYGLASSVADALDAPYIVAGRAYRYYYTETQEMAECDVWLNSVIINEQLLDVLVLHELGHCMGLLHSSEENAVMYYVPTAKSFHIDDYAGLTELYSMCRDKNFTDYMGNMYIARLDVEDLLEALDDRAYDMFRGVELSAYLDAGGIWPSSVYNVKQSSCEGGY